MMRECSIFNTIKIIYFKKTLSLFNAFFIEENNAIFFINAKIFFVFELLSYAIGELVVFKCAINRSRDDKRCACFINKDRIYLINNRKIVLSLHFLRKVIFHIVSQIIKAKFIICAINNITRICLQTFIIIADFTCNNTYFKAQKIIKWF